MRTESSPASHSRPRASGSEPFVFAWMRAAPVSRAHEPDRALDLLPARERLALAALAEADHHRARRALEVAERDLRHLLRGRGRAIRSCDEGGIPSCCSERQPTQAALHAADDGIAPSSRA